MRPKQKPKTKTSPVSTNEQPALAAEQEIAITVRLAGHGLKYVSSREEADVIYVNKDGQPFSFAKYSSDVYGYEIRSASRMTGACRALLYNGTLETARHEAPIIPQSVIYAARAREAFEQIQKAA